MICGCARDFLTNTKKLRPLKTADKRHNVVRNNITPSLGKGGRNAARSSEQVHYGARPRYV